MPQTATEIATSAVATLLSSSPVFTNFNSGSGVRSLVDAFSAELAVLDQSAEDQFATAVLNALQSALGIPVTDATGSVYSVQFSSSASSSTTLSVGTAVAIPNSTLQWITGQTVTVPAGGSITTTVSCTSTGSITNVPANSITQLVVPVTGITVTNPSAKPIVPGQDAATQTQVQAQTANAIAQMQAGINQSIESAAITAQLTDASGNPTEQVMKAKYYDGITPGTGYCYVYNGSGPMSSDLLAQTQNVIDGYTNADGSVVEGVKPAGAYIYATDAPETDVTVSVAVLPTVGLSLSAIQTGVQTAIEQYFTNLDLGTAVSLQQLAYAILAVPGVADAQTPVTSPSSLPATPSVAVPDAPTLTAVSPSPVTGLAAGTYYVSATYTNPWGETTDSIETSVTLTAGQAIQVDSITLATGATGVNYYLSVSEGSTTVALATSGDGSQITLTALPASDAVSPPVENTAIINGNAYVLNGTPVVTEM